MRYSLYNHINNMINTLMEAVNYVGQSQNIEMSIQLLINCTEVIDSLKKVLLENSKSITELEIFDHMGVCENQVDELVKSIQSNKDYDDQIEFLDNDIKQLQIMFQNNVHYRYRIVFFAELGQKWDAMNSVYRAFKNREDCEVRVVLTPIFREVRKNGKVEREVIYEDYLTPMGIDYIPYEEYDLSEDLPDMTFISNPYESVTLPQFWPENISKYTKLVYVPYYTGMMIDSNNIQVNCKFPVAQYAWRIIAQSNKIKKLHQQFAPRKGKNVLVTGLPKWDEIPLTSDKLLEMPSNWKGKLKGKKVFLWNSHYNVSSPNSTLLDVGKEIIGFFSKNQDISLIWRPHPMTETIFKLYSPQHAPYWNELKNKVEKSNNIIIDNNPSYKYAFQYSDALISEYSSMIGEYMLTHKPILWTKRSITNSFFEDEEMLVKINQLEKATSSEQIVDFVKRIINGIDLNESIGVKTIEEDLPNYGRGIGQKVCNLLIEQFCLE